MLINVKTPKWYYAGQQHLPGGGTEFPPVGDTNAERVEDEEQEKCAVNGPHQAHHVRVSGKVFEGHRYEKQYQQ